MRKDVPGKYRFGDFFYRILMDFGTHMYTCDQVIPSALLNNLLHAMIISGSHSISEEENQNKVDIIADIKN